jgi:hypothetical protein
MYSPVAYEGKVLGRRVKAWGKDESNDYIGLD